MDYLLILVYCQMDDIMTKRFHKHFIPMNYNVVVRLIKVL